jgi:arsenate reductase
VPQLCSFGSISGARASVLELIRNAGIEPVVIEYLQNPPSRATLVELIDQAGLTVREAIRQKGTPYQELGLDDPAVSDEQLIDAMLANPILINRPFVVTPSSVRLCRPSELVLDILTEPQRGAFTKEDGEPVIDEQGQRIHHE